MALARKGTRSEQGDEPAPTWASFVPWAMYGTES